VKKCDWLIDLNRLASNISAIFRSQGNVGLWKKNHTCTLREQWHLIQVWSPGAGTGLVQWKRINDHLKRYMIVCHALQPPKPTITACDTDNTATSVKKNYNDNKENCATDEDSACTMSLMQLKKWWFSRMERDIAWKYRCY
jgi:hypothetical protein